MKVSLILEKGGLSGNMQVYQSNSFIFQRTKLVRNSFSKPGNNALKEKTLKSRPIHLDFTDIPNDCKENRLTESNTTGKH